MQDFCHKGQPPLGEADLNRAVRAAVSAHAGEGAAVSLELDPALPPVQGTALDLERLVGVLLSSAAAETASGETAVVVRTERGPDSSVCLRVEDTAPEPDEDLMPRLFEPFQTTKEQGRGVGLGLAVSRSIVDRHNGKIEVKSELGKGTTFRVVLPLDGKAMSENRALAAATNAR